MSRTPDEIMQDFKDATNGIADVSVMDAFWEILDDVLDSVKLACAEYDQHERDLRCKAATDEIYSTVHDYVANHYGDD